MIAGAHRPASAAGSLPGSAHEGWIGEMPDDVARRRDAAYIKSAATFAFDELTEFLDTPEGGADRLALRPE